MGKSIVRTRRPLILGIHRPRPSGDHPRRNLRRNLRREAIEMRRTQRLHLTHFDGLTPFHWVAKLWRMARLMPEAKLASIERRRQALIRLAQTTLPDIGPIHSLERDPRRLDPPSVAALRKAGAIHDLGHDPAEAVIARGLLTRAEFLPEAFDREMARMYPRLEPVLQDWQVLETTERGRVATG